MSKLMISLGIGVVAGLIDIAPMLIRKMSGYACLAAFVHWVVLGIIIAYINWPMPSYAKGSLVAFICTVPVVLMVAERGLKAALPILIVSVVLGALVGWATAKFAP